MRINVDTARCSGHGVCQLAAPEVFEVGDDSVVHLLTDHPGDELRSAVEDAVAECPEQALRLEG
jgi:ferredoxin